MEHTSARNSKLIIGLGKTGLACARYFSKQGFAFAVMDDRQQPPMLQDFLREFPQVDLYLGEFDEQRLCTASEVIISPGVSLQQPAIQTALARDVSFISDVEVFCRVAQAPIVAVTGSNGKSTVVTMLAEAIEQAGLTVGLGGNIGLPVLDLLKKPEPDLYVLELSSFQLETVFSLNAKASVILNISEDHMDRYADMHEYALAKSRVYSGDGVMVLNRDDALVMQHQQAHRNRISFGSDKPGAGDYGLLQQQARTVLVRGEQALLSTDDMRIKGLHNCINALAVLALAEAIGLPQTGVINSVKQFKGLAHRCQLVAKMNGVEWINDSKGTNVGATIAAIDGLAMAANNLILIAGGVGKDADFSPLADAVSKSVKQVVLYGRDARIIGQSLHGQAVVHYVDDLCSAVSLADAISKAGDRVLFSPACASFDMFDNYEQRGQAFIESVQRLPRSADE